MDIVLSLGGSILPREATGLRRTAAVLASLARRHRLRVVVGGGQLARDFIGVARGLGATEALCDELGILATRMNARLLLSALPGAHPGVPETYAQAARARENPVVMGGVSPGHTTDAVAAILADYVDADLLVNATNVDAIYTQDPRIHPRARRIRRMSHRQLVELTSRAASSAGGHTPFDLLASKVLQRARIPLVVVDGRNPENIRRALTRNPPGTVVGGSERRPSSRGVVGRGL
ncbi:MAG: UMP kinase [Euryarchaeota archaeon]|nr:UMP kinase [Euryarchaeota archaeon]